MPKKPRWTRFPVRVRAHSNPLSDETFPHPYNPDNVQYADMFPGRAEQTVHFVDIGCAYGGLLKDLSVVFPEKNMLGIEIRPKVVGFAQDRAQHLRTENPGQYNNIWYVRGNAMKHLPHHFHKGQLQKMFFCFPDPHYKKKNFRRRIISTQLLSEYTYCLAKGGILYTITDVPELGDWMRTHCEQHPLLEKIEEAEWKNDPIVQYISKSSEDAKRTIGQNLGMHVAIFRKK